MTADLSVVACSVRVMTDAKNETRRPPVAQTLTLLFDNDPTWGDLIWFAKQVEAAGVDPAQKVLFEYDEDHDQLTGISFFTHPDPAAAS